MIALDLKKAELKILYIFEYFLASSDHISEHQFHHVEESGSMLEII